MGGGSSLSAAARKRIEMELNEINENPPANWKIVRQSDDVWDIWITTGVETPYHSIPFKVIAKFPSNYPESRPILTVQCYNRFFHPNVDPKDGTICERTLKNNDQKIQIRERIDALVSLLASPNPVSWLNQSAATMFRDKYHEYYTYALYKFRGLS